MARVGPLRHRKKKNSFIHSKHHWLLPFHGRVTSHTAFAALESHTQKFKNRYIVGRAQTEDTQGRGNMRTLERES